MTADCRIDGHPCEPTCPGPGANEPSVWRVGKRAAGRELDGRTWDEYPEVRR